MWRWEQFSHSSLSLSSYCVCVEMLFSFTFKLSCESDCWVDPISVVSVVSVTSWDVLFAWCRSINNLTVLKHLLHDHRICLVTMRIDSLHQFGFNNVLLAETLVSGTHLFAGGDFFVCTSLYGLITIYCSIIFILNHPTLTLYIMWRMWIIKSLFHLVLNL